MSTVIKGSGNGQINLNDTTGSIQLNGSDVLTIDSSGNLTAPNDVSIAGTMTANAFSGDGSGLTGISAGGFSNMDVITSTGTWTNPGSVTKVKVTVVGGGGGAGGSSPNSTDHLSGGGGGGGTAIEVATIPTSPVPVTVGSGGAGATGNNTGSTGGTSSFGAYCSATGGAGSVPAFPGNNYRVWYGGAGGVGSGGNININGGNGGPEGMIPIDNTAPDIIANFANGWGGTSYLSAGSEVRRGRNLSSDGVPGLDYGGGGGGCGDRAAGGPGAAGVVIVEY